MSNMREMVVAANDCHSGMESHKRNWQTHKSDSWRKRLFGTELRQFRTHFEHGVAWCTQEFNVTLDHEQTLPFYSRLMANRLHCKIQTSASHNQASTHLLAAVGPEPNTSQQEIWVFA